MKTVYLNEQKDAADAAWKAYVETTLSQGINTDKIEAMLREDLALIQAIIRLTNCGDALDTATQAAKKFWQK